MVINTAVGFMGGSALTEPYKLCFNQGFFCDNTGCMCMFVINFLGGKIHLVHRHETKKLNCP